MNLLKRLDASAEYALSMIGAKSEANLSAAHHTVNQQVLAEVWKRNGGKIFLLSKELIEAFSNTEISLLTCPDSFKYPFNSFIIEGESPLCQIKNHRDECKGIESILYVNKESILTANVVGVNISNLNSSPVSNVQWDGSVNGFYPYGTGVGSIMLFLHNGVPIRKKDDDYSGNVGEGVSVASIDSNKKLANIFFNTILYINDPTRNITETESRSSRKVKISSKESMLQKYIYLKPPKYYKSLYASSGKTLDVRFIVRGHWRNQACGASHKDHKRIWVLPYWKGPEMSEIVSKKYVVK